MSRIKVCCRIREEEDLKKNCVEYVDNEDKSEVSIGSNRFCLDYVIDRHHSQSMIFTKVVQPILSDAFQGYNCSIFTYGQTGSGKTYTLVGNLEDEEAKGIIPRTSDLLFMQKSKVEQAQYKVQIKLSIIEIYQEKLNDLLLIRPSSSWSVAQMASKSQNLRIREQIDGTVWVEGLSEVVLSSSEEFLAYFATAAKRRVVGSHNLNQVSSRSHFCCIFSILQSELKSGTKVSSKVHLIDLAGSEMARKTDAEGTRFEEAKHINKSLSALGNVINALAQSSSKQAPTTQRSSSLPASQAASSGSFEGTSSLPIKASLYIPYRDSKLTRILQNALGGNAKTLIILTISAAASNMQESISTLKFGDRAQLIQLKPKVNKMLMIDESKLKKALADALNEITELKATIASLEGELFHLKSKAGKEISQSLMASDLLDMTSKEELVCDICRHFLSQQDKRMVGLPPNGPTSSEMDQSQPPLDHGEHGGSSHGDDQGDNIDNDEAAPCQQVDRCVICGLSSDESEALFQDTGERLGEMFRCDGNCGGLFHVRCVGLVGDGGQFMLPEGEWYCTECTSSFGNPISIESSASNTLEQEDRATTLLQRGTSSSAPEDRAGMIDVIANIKSEYHSMRKERNRILLQWQQERRMQLKIEEMRTKSRRKMDAEVVGLKQSIEDLESRLESTQEENMRLKALLDMIYQEHKVDDTKICRLDEPLLRQHTRNFTDELDLLLTPGNRRQDDSNNLQDGEGNNKEEKIRSIRQKKLQSFSKDLKKILMTEQQKEYQRSISEKLQVHTLKQSWPQAVDALEASTIPKPWLRKSSNQEDTLGPSLLFPPELHGSPKDSVQAGDTDETGDESSLHALHGYGHSDSRTSTRNRYNEKATFEGISSQDLVDEDDRLSGKSKFINPLRNRLRGLIQTIQKETDSFVEIRQKFQDREMERNHLRKSTGSVDDA